MDEYFLGYPHTARLLKLAQEHELAAIRRLDDFAGTENDMRTAAEIYRRAGQSDMAEIVEDALRRESVPCT